tara:strand:+ start:457 stop:870 length:414 start_codon:yes stop_codon:yes gene_type:complete
MSAVDFDDVAMDVADVEVGPGVFAMAFASPIVKSNFLENLSAAPNSLGEIVLRWDLDNNDIETCIIVATFNGVTAPLGTVAVYPGITNYEFTDRVLNAFVGKKVYRILSVSYDGSVYTSSKNIETSKKSNFPTRMLR